MGSEASYKYHYIINIKFSLYHAQYYQIALRDSQVLWSFLKLESFSHSLQLYKKIYIFCIHQRKESHTSLEQHKFLVELFLWDNRLMVLLDLCAQVSYTAQCPSDLKLECDTITQHILTLMLHYCRTLDWSAVSLDLLHSVRFTHANGIEAEGGEESDRQREMVVLSNYFNMLWHKSHTREFLLSAWWGKTQRWWREGKGERESPPQKEAEWS